MILKNLTRRSGLIQLFHYVFEKERDNLYKSKESLVFSHNYRSTDLKGMIEEFQQNELHRLHHRKDGVLVNHLVLSFNPNDSRFLTDEIIKDLVKKCIGIKLDRALVCGTEHLDKDFRHVHLIWSSIEYKTGKSLRMSRTEFKNWKIELDKYQKEKYPELSHSLPSHGKQKDFLQKHIDRRHTELKEIVTVLRQVVIHSVSKQDFILKLEATQCKPYFRSDKVNGVMFNNRKYRFTTLGLSHSMIENIKNLGIEIKNLDQFKSLRDRNSRSREIEILREF